MTASLSELREQITAGSTSIRAAVESAVGSAEKLNDDLNAFLEIDRSGALKRADTIDQKIKTDEASALLPLTGIPIAIKDNICVRGLQTSCGSRILGPYKPPYNATAIERLLEAGSVIIGKTNCDEFAMGSSNENSAFGPVKNPWDTSRVPGGSSGGSAAAVAAGIVPVALGSDTGGSVRQPASLVGVLGRYAHRLLLATTADQQFGMRLLQRLGKERGLGELIILAIESCGGLGPEPEQHLAGFFKAV